MTDIWPAHLFLVGCGNMAGQMLARWLDCGLDPSRVTVLRPSGRPVADGVQVVTEYPASLAAQTTILLGMKPYQLADIAGLLAPLCGSRTRILSILAGTPLADLRAHFPDAGEIVRAMPNLPVGIGEGVTALHAEAAVPATSRTEVEALVAPLGLAEWIADEAQFNEVTALSGCGPAFLFRFIDAFARAGEAIGLPADKSARMAMATVHGSASMAAKASESPAILADRVASPGGMTREGLNILDANDRLLKLLTDTLLAARDRGQAMAKGQ
ncbi:pyrroline-5-carboxylate reductase family protein [Sphingobium bisphenolivorans]|uniref:pyrroline-5-carboxylate reductase family protein n=1 Tax=Sphingobium bisphenolivorans TaxID=1335760 RepID=UPI0003A2FE97|nr:pyrroline-5-carboxylate reductase [Sphingobium bisphenolivorans]